MLTGTYNTSIINILINYLEVLRGRVPHLTHCGMGMAAYICAKATRAKATRALQRWSWRLGGAWAERSGCCCTAVDLP